MNEAPSVIRFAQPQHTCPHCAVTSMTSRTVPRPSPSRAARPGEGLPSSLWHQARAIYHNLALFATALGRKQAYYSQFTKRADTGSLTSFVLDDWNDIRIVYAADLTVEVYINGTLSMESTGPLDYGRTNTLSGFYQNLSSSAGFNNGNGAWRIDDWTEQSNDKPRYSISIRPTTLTLPRSEQQRTFASTLASPQRSQRPSACALRF